MRQRTKIRDDWFDISQYECGVCENAGSMLNGLQDKAERETAGILDCLEG